MLNCISVNQLETCSSTQVPSRVPQAGPWIGGFFPDLSSILPAPSPAALKEIFGDLDALAANFPNLTL